MTTDRAAEQPAATAGPPSRRLTDAEVDDVVALLRPHRQLLIDHARGKAAAQNDHAQPA